MRWWRGWWVLLYMLAVLAILVTACRYGEAPSPALRAQPVTSTPTPTPTSTPEPTPTPNSSLPAHLRGFTMPIAGACLPNSDNLMPNAPRLYRAGVHEGIDFYDGYVCTRVTRGTPVVAAKAGTVIRADVDYRQPTREELQRLLNISQQRGYTDEETLDILRGRQVWIDHGDGLVTRYAHLLDVAGNIRRGVRITAGDVIGYVGNSGILDGIDNPNAEIHLHLEIRVGPNYLGQGLSPTSVRNILQRAFATGH